MTRRAWLIAGTLLFAAAWLGPLPALVPQSFAAHMGLHMMVVAGAAPVFAMGWIAGREAPRTASLGLLMIAGIADLAIIWLWHMPQLHHLARTEPWGLALEQASFAAAALLLWIVALSGPALAGAATLFFTAMHMTLLGALLALSPTPLYPGHHNGPGALADQHVGGVLMLAIGGSVYVGAGLILAARVLRLPRP